MITAKEIVENGCFAKAASAMDDEIREDLHMQMAPCTELEFLEAYIERHWEKYHEHFENYFG